MAGAALVEKGFEFFIAYAEILDGHAGGDEALAVTLHHVASEAQLLRQNAPVQTIPVHTRATDTLSCVCNRTASFSLPFLCDLFEIDIPFLHIRVNKLYLEPLTHIDIFKSVEQPAFERRLENPDPCPFVGCACTDGLEPVSDP
jgi:hypothetical protein